MHDDIVVSVIVLTYNQENYIRCALDSVLNQKVDFRYEILIGDDSSTDETKHIVQEYAQNHSDVIRLFLRENNLGAARNAYELLLSARGKYLAFCEGDDYWTDSEKLAIQVRFLEENPEFIGCSHRCEIVDAKGKRKENQHLKWVREKKCFTLDDFKGLYLPGQTATILKRNLFLNSKDSYHFLYQASKDISDRTSTLLYLSQGSFGFIPRIMSAYRKTDQQSITDRLFAKNSDKVANELDFTDRLKIIGEELAPGKDIFSAYYCFLYMWAIGLFIKSPSKKTAGVVFDAAKRIGPGVIHPIAFARGIVMKIMN